MSAGSECLALQLRVRSAYLRRDEHSWDRQVRGPDSQATPSAAGVEPIHSSRRRICQPPRRQRDGSATAARRPSSPDLRLPFAITHLRNLYPAHLTDSSMQLFKAAKAFDGAETLVEEGRMLRGVTLVEKARRVPCLAPGFAEKGCSSLKLETFDVEATSPSTQAGIPAVVERLRGQLDAWKKDPNQKATEAIPKIQKKLPTAQEPAQDVGHVEPTEDNAQHPVSPFTPPTHKHIQKDTDSFEAAGGQAERESKDIDQKRNFAQNKDKCCKIARYQTERDGKDTARNNRASAKGIIRLEAAKDRADYNGEGTAQNKATKKHISHLEVAENHVEHGGRLTAQEKKKAAQEDEQLDVAEDQAEHGAKAPTPTLSTPLTPSNPHPAPDSRRHGISSGPSATTSKPAQRNQTDNGGHGEQKLSLLSLGLRASGEALMKNAPHRPREPPAVSRGAQPHVAPSLSPESWVLEPARPPVIARSKLKMPHIEYEYDEDGMVMGSELVDKVIEVYMRVKPDWGIDDTPPPLSWKQMVSKILTPTRVWDAETAQRQSMWKLQWQTQIVMMDQSHRNVLAFEARKEIYQANVREEEELCQYKAEHEARLRYIMFVEAPKFWEQLGV
ncbi:uncharacterized protein BDZ99DRAFT_563057 [Mytilinidion resinicola]|uniref:Uncharacterized protein n=1 Tax=Mytilinidion resinicola TaxID=574789 RepID=A0A6A6YNY2_9PEZI|nr:uncharacterized protein BDZ99DRAFT_563057 [Mytilinidion resinicola]KAF2810238.1 hypothetical protein BDZ99DRAFT_563057 [Mytilinidion resinicola]